MKLRYFMFFILIGLLFAASISGCSTASQVDVTETLSEAQTQLASGDLDGARESYESALAADPTNAESNFGAAMLGILNVAVDENTRT
ncbi:MAG: hypothetical protein KJ732_04310, partial [Candidatus Margulisbacteria bacterium]|nr:hypothetical protein [Candidatus Margulisiibacteriota bacterium]